MRRTLLLGVGLAFWLGTSTATAKRYGVSSPGGRRTYDEYERFDEALDQNRRHFVVETAVGLGPEGHLGLLLGWLNQPVNGLEYYVGFGYESNPARHYTGTVRYAPNIHGFRPYVALGYLYKDLTVLRTYSHNVFGEIGYSFKIHQTYRLTAGVGVRYIAHLGIHNDSPLMDDDVDPVLLKEQQDSIERWVPMGALRFSRAF